MALAVSAAAQPVPRTTVVDVRSPLAFEANEGQVAADVDYLSRGPDYTLLLSRTALLLALQPSLEPDVRSGLDPSPRGGTSGGVVRFLLDGSAGDHPPVPEAPSGGRANYLIGADPRRWHTGIPVFARVRYPDVYPGIDVVYYGTDRGRLEYDFLVAPGADPSRIRLAVQGPDEVTVDRSGHLMMTVGGLRATLKAPTAYQIVGGAHRVVAARFVTSIDDRAKRAWRLRFAIGRYDPSLPLVIDPVVVYGATPGNGFGYEVAADAAGNAFVTGFTSALQTIPGAIQGGFQGGTRDAFVTKLDPAGHLVYSTYLGGSGNEEGRSLTVNGAGEAIVTGFTQSLDFPRAAPWQPVFGGGSHDAFLTMLNGNGSALIFSTFLGGTGADFGHDVTIQGNGSIYVTGVTSSPDFPAVGALQPFLRGSSDAFVVTMGQGGQLVRSTYLGGSACDSGWGIAVDASGAAYVTGQTNSADFPVVAAAQPGFGGDGVPSCNGVFGGDAFIARFDPGGSTLTYATFLGGSQGEIGNGIAVDAGGRAVVAGRTDSFDFPVRSAVQPRYGGGPGGSLLGGDGFVARLSASGRTFAYVTFLGGSDGDAALDVAVDPAGQAYTTGHAYSTDFPLASPFQSFNAGLRDLFVTKLSEDGSTLLYSSYLGEAQGDGAFGLAVTASRDQFVAGFLGGLNFVGRVSLRTLTVARAGDGAGSVTSVPVGIACGSNCAASFETGREVILNAVADSGTLFVGWSAGCEAGVVDLATDRTCTASFARDTDQDGLADAWELQFGLLASSAAGPDGAMGDPDGDGLTNLEEYAGGSHPRGFAGLTRRLAEGASTSFFSTALAIANPSSSVGANVLVRLQLSDGRSVSRFESVGPLTRRTILVSDLIGSPVEFSILVESDQFVLVDRTMRWDASGYGSHSEAGLPQTATTWYLAEGATHSGFNLFYLLQNPGTQRADVEVTFLLPGGVVPVVRPYTVPAGSRFTIWVNAEGQSVPSLRSTDVSAVIRSTNLVPIVVERAMYLDAGGLPFGAGHEAAGVTAPATNWFLAEGATGDFFDLFVLLANPGPGPAEVEATYLKPDGATIVRTYTVAPQARFNVWVDKEDAGLSDTAVSTMIRSTNGVPILAERAMWWPGPTAMTWHEAHVSPGATATGTRWGTAEGEAGGTFNTSTYVLIANTSASPGAARVTLLFEDGTTAERTFSLAASSRFNVDVGSAFPVAVGRRFGVLVESLGTPAAELVVERAMYSDARGVVWAAGTNALATRLP